MNNSLSIENFVQKLIDENIDLSTSYYQKREINIPINKNTVKSLVVEYNEDGFIDNVYWWDKDFDEFDAEELFDELERRKVIS